VLEILREYDVVGAFWLTIQLTLASALGSLLIGTVVAVMRVSPVRTFSWAGAAYVNIVRNTPLTLIFFFFAFGAPLLVDFRVDFLTLGIWALGIYTATYVAETLRSGINTVPVGQAEAARAIGLPFTKVMSLVVLPQAARSVIPPMMSVLIALLKNTTVAAGFSVFNLGSIRATMSEKGENQMVTLLWVMFIFVVMVLLLAWLQRVLENRWRVAR